MCAVKRKSRKSREWVDATNNEFKLIDGKVWDNCICFQAKRRIHSSSLRFDIGQLLFLYNQGQYYVAEVTSFAPRSRCGSVIAASGLLTLVLQEDIAQALQLRPSDFDFSDLSE
jgi:hypothetical protein